MKNNRLNIILTIENHEYLSNLPRSRGSMNKIVNDLIAKDRLNAVISKTEKTNKTIKIEEGFTE